MKLTFGRPRDMSEKAEHYSNLMRKHLKKLKLFWLCSSK